MATPTDTLTDQKQRLREQAADRRAAAHAARGASAGDALSERFCAALKDQLPGSTVSLYWPMRDEMDVTPLFAALAGQGIPTALPVMAGPDEPLMFRTWAPGAPLVDEAFGVREPGLNASAADPDIVGVPLLGFDAAGNRLGYGGGYYDRTLRILRALGALRADRKILAVGICYDEQEFTALPNHAGDQRLDMIITDRRTIPVRQ